MAENTKALKFEAIYDARGADKILKLNEDLRKGYAELGKIVKDLGKGLQDLDSMQKRRTDTTAKETEQIRQQIEQLKRLRQEHLMIERIAQGASVRAMSTGARNVSVGGGGFGGGGTGVLSGNGANYNGPSSPAGGIAAGFRGFMGKAAPILGMVGAGVGMVGGVVGAVGEYMQHSGRAEAHEKTMALENLARAQGYRNHMFMESRQAPIGYVGYKQATNFNLKSRDSDKVEVDDFGNIIQPKNATNIYSGGGLQGRAQNMTGEMREHQGKIVSGYGNMIGAAGKGISGAGLIAGALGGAAFGATVGSVIPGVGTAIGGAVGGVIGGVAASGGVGAIVSAIKEGTAAYFQVHHEEKKLREGELEAQQSEASVTTDKLKDEVLAITRYQMGVLTGAAGSMASANRSTLGNEGLARGFAEGGFDIGEAYGITSGAIRGFGRAGKAGIRSIFGAADRGMSSGLATEVVGAFGARGGNGGASLERLMQMAVKHGMESVDIGFFEKLAGATAKGHYNQGGIVGNDAAALMFAGMYRPDQYNVQDRMRGVQAGDALFTENSYFRSRGMVDAAAILGSGAEGAQVAALAEASMGELIGGGGSLLGSGITDDQREKFRHKRVNNLGDVLGGYDRVKKLVGGQDFDTYIRDLSQRLSDPESEKVRGKAQSELETLRFYGGKLTGVDQGHFGEILASMGARAGDMSSGDLSKMKLFSRKGGQAAAILGTQNQMHNQDVKGGKEALNDAETSKRLIDFQENPKFVNEMMRNDPNRFAKWSQDPSRYAGEIKMAYQKFQGNEAKGAGPGYDSTQKLNEALGNTAKILNEEVAIALQNFARRLDGKKTIPNPAKELTRVTESPRPGSR